MLELTHSRSENGLRPIFVDLGSFVGRALYDSRLIDFNFNKVFLKAVLGEIVDLSSETLKVRRPLYIVLCIS